MKIQITVLQLLFPLLILGQSFVSYFTGNPGNVNPGNVKGGTVLMGGGTENDEAMRWFLERAGGGDVLVLRASGSDDYNDYFYSELGVRINSVETIVFRTKSAAEDLYVHTRIRNAEAIWIAGGDQKRYFELWDRTTLIDLINDRARSNFCVLGGTSAGMAVLGENYFSAENGTIRSEEALQNPFDSKITIRDKPLFRPNFLEETITDTHYDNPDRKGRHTVFMARTGFRGIACDEFTAVCVDEDGKARVFGGYPEFDDNAYFIQPNCANAEPAAEVMEAGQPLSWNKNAAALKTYQVKGTASGAFHFDLSDWEGGAGGSWHNWWVENGRFNELPSDSLDCQNVVNVAEHSTKVGVRVFPNPSNGLFQIEAAFPVREIEIFDMNGRKVPFRFDGSSFSLPKQIRDGVFILKLKTKKGTAWQRVVVY